MKYHEPDDDAGEMEDIEAQLRSLRPRPASPEFQRRIAGRLEDAPLIPPRWYAPLAIAASLAMAATLTALLLAQTPRPAATGEPANGPQVSAPSLDLTRPTFMAYRHALGHSVGDLTDLLDQHARHHRGSAAALPETSPPLHVRSLPPL